MNHHYAPGIDASPTRLTDPILVTGATGNVGNALVHRLLRDGYQVHALVRDAVAARQVLPEGVVLHRGDVTAPDSLPAAMAGVGTVVHAAGLPEQWLADPEVFERVNHRGTAHVADAALAAEVSCFVHVSTIDVFTWRRGEPFTEVIDPDPKHTVYERSKQAADRAVTERMAAGLPARFACPSAVFGPTPTTTAGVTSLMRDLAARKVPMILPGGFPIVFNEDCADGIIRIGLAPVGTRAILSGPYLTLVEIAEAVQQVVPTARIPRILPIWFAHLVSNLGERRARRTGRPPMIAAGQLHFLEDHVVPDATFATANLGWRQTPLHTAIERTLASALVTADAR